MRVKELYDMKVGDLLKEFCIVYSPECGYNYGIARWDDVGDIYEEFDLEEEYCFSGDSLIPFEYMCNDEEEVLDLKTLKEVMDKLGIRKKQSCPACDSDNYHFDYNKMSMLCEDCGHEAE